MLDLDEPMRPDLVEPLDVLLMGVADGDAQDLEVEALLVAHLEPADRARPDVAAGEGRLVDDQQGVGVIAVAGARPLDEPVVEVVVDRADSTRSSRKTPVSSSYSYLFRDPRGISTTISTTSGNGPGDFTRSV